jgi:rod shape-determining protein MreC
VTTLRRRLVDWSLTGVLILAPLLVLRTSVARGTPSGFDRAIVRITAPLEAGVSWIVEGIGGLWERYVAVVGVAAENRELRADNDKLREQLGAMARKAYDTAALEDLAVIKRRTPADTIGARVIGAPMSPQFRVVRLRIDRGEHEVATGMPVIVGDGPVGRVDKVYGDYADVTLISDPSSSVEIVIPRTGGRGILTGLGRGDSYACTLEWLEKQAPAQAVAAKVEVGDEVVTSGLGASFPPGLVVGKVSKVAHDDGMFQRVEVEPAVDVSRVRAVEVLLAPAPPPDPDAKTKKHSEPAFGGRVM